jgi:glucan phosphoethanolaminetransferase (alkaline phosphatase superfamily)
MTAGLFVVAVLLAAACRPTTSEVPCPDCNILLISMDTLRADHLGAYGYARPTSPNIDALASDSVVFERAFSQSA